MSVCGGSGSNDIQDDSLKEHEIEKRRDAGLRRALATPPKPKQESVKRKEREPQKGEPAKRV